MIPVFPGLDDPIPFYLRLTVHDKFTEHEPALGVFHKGMSEQLLSAGPLVGVYRETLFDEIREFGRSAVRISESLRRVVLDHEHGPHGVNVRQGRLALCQLDAGYPKTPDIYHMFTFFIDYLFSCYICFCL